ncbi:MAG: hypothetical protein KIT00_07580 [Rhodospirillales bacterium]|nr:hypothetical protein [Rhodospirillales bacterium]
MKKLIGLAVTVAVMGVTAGHAIAAQDPVCSPKTLGQTACFTAKLCECIHDRGGKVTARPPGYRWDCGILRPSCGEAADQPVSIQEFRGNPPAYPLAVGKDNSRRAIVINPRRPTPLQ